MTTYNLSSSLLDDNSEPVKRTAASINVTDDLNAREDRLLRFGNGIRDEVVFPRLRAMGVGEAGLHRATMQLVRRVQCGKDPNGNIARLLGVTPAVVNGTIAAPEVG